MKAAIFSDVVLISDYHGCKGEAIKLIPYYIIDIIYKSVTSSRLKKLQITQNIKNLMFQVILIFPDWILIKQIIVSSTLFCCWEKTDFRKNAAWGDDKNLGASFEWGGAWVKMPQINAFFRNVNSINLKIFPTHGGM